MNPKSWKAIVAMGGGVLLIAAVMIVGFTPKYRARVLSYLHLGKTPATTTTTKTDEQKKPAPPDPLERLKALGLVGNGEGEEHGFIRELKFDPSLADASNTKPCKFKGNSADAVAVALWAGFAAHCVAKRAGYVDSKFWPAQMRVMSANMTSFVLVKMNGRLMVKEFRLARKSEGRSPPVYVEQRTRTLVANASTGANFIGRTPSAIPPYLYVYPEVKDLKALAVNGI